LGRGDQEIQEFQLENDKKYVRFFKSLILSVDFKPRRPGTTQEPG
jgi:hypothetical protein